MNTLDIIKNIGSKALNPIITVAKNNPMRAVGFGLAMLAVGDIMLVKATMESSNDIEEVGERANDIHNDVTKTNAQKAKELTFNYIHFTRKVSKRVALPLIVKAIGVGAIIGGANQLNINAITAGATASMLEAHLNNLYQRIENKYGKEAADELRYNIKETEVEEEVTDEKGNKSVVKKVVKKGDPNGYIPLLERYYDQSNPTFDRGLNGYLTNVDRVRNAVIWAQKKIDAGIPVTWNELFGSLGFLRIIPGCNHGWKKGMTIDLGVNLYPQTNDEAMQWGDCVILKPNCVKLYDVTDTEECFKTTIYGGPAIDAL